MGNLKEIKKKIILLGDGAVGKTSLIRKYVVDKFDDNYLLTVGFKITQKEITVKVDKVNSCRSLPIATAAPVLGF